MTPARSKRSANAATANDAFAGPRRYPRRPSVPNRRGPAPRAHQRKMQANTRSGVAFSAIPTGTSPANAYVTVRAKKPNFPRSLCAYWPG